MSQRSVILLEFNELTPRLMDRFIADGCLPNFERLRREAQVHTTVADEVAPCLDPWIQWITIHSGVPYQEHRIRELVDGYKLQQKNVWDLVSDSGRPVFVCGSMNIQYRRPINGWVLPDPWSTKVPPHPRALDAYFKFVRAHVTEYTNDAVPLSLLDQAEFVLFMARHGLSARTVSAIARQLLAERSAPVRWKRAVIHDRMQMDLFRWHWRRARPALSTFFLNSTAHFQHLYWRHMEPELFQIQPSESERALYQGAIRFGYQQMDRLVGEFLELAGRDTTLVFLTAFSQQPCLTWEERGGKVPHRPHDFERFLRDVGVGAPVKVSPVMTHQFHVDFEDEAAAAAGEDKLRALEIRGLGKVLSVKRDGKKIFSGCEIYQPMPRSTEVALAGGGSLPFHDLFYQMDLMKSGMHHPDGMLWIRTPDRHHAVNPDKVPIENVAPTILEMFGLPKPDHMKGTPIRPRVRLVAA